MSQVTYAVQADMAQTDPSKNDYIEGQAAAWAAASANASALIATAIAALNLGTAAMQAATAFDAAGAASSAQSAAISSAASSLTAAIAGLATVARSGVYTDLTSKPTLGTAAAQNTGAFDASGAASSAIAALCSGTTLQFIRGDGTLATFSTAAISAVTWSTLTGKPTFANVATSGAYSDLSGTPSLGTQMSVDSGWTANSTVGDKTASLSSYSNGINSTIITALNLAAANSGTAIGALGDIVVTLVKQVAAIRTALIVAKLPNV